MAAIDFGRINEEVLSRYPGVLSEWFPDGVLSGSEFKALNPTRKDGRRGSFSININTGVWSDFATGDFGKDPVSLYAYAFCHGKQGDAAKELSKVAVGQPRQTAADKKKYKQITPVPTSAPPPDFNHYKHKKPNHIWAYRNSAGETLGYCCRFDLPGGGKEVLPLIFDGHAWRWQAFDKPRPMYGLDRLAANKTANVILVEGEKCADALQKMLPKNPVVSWPGGTNAVGFVDFSPLDGRNVVAWPDFDSQRAVTNDILPRDKQPGFSAMMNIARKCKYSGFKIIDYDPQELGGGWDCADAIAEGWGVDKISAFIKGRARAVVEYGPEQELPNAVVCGVETVEAVEEKEAFQFLGYNHGAYYYLPSGTRQVVALSAAEHKKNQLLALAPLLYWEDSFSGKAGVDWDGAADYLMRRSEQKGVYDIKKIRGRGAWEDDGKVVLHVGSHIIVDGKKVNIRDIHDSEYVYEAAIPMVDRDLGNAHPLSVSQANRFVALCDMIPWEMPISSRLLAGWCVLAPICGALKWRPHIHLTGAAGSGKSWTLDNIVRPTVGPSAILVQSNTTEAGLRQTLGYDARPIIFDEAEAEDQAGRARVQKIIELARQSSSEASADIIKGTPSGKALSYRIRSVFLFGSIGSCATQKADISRISQLSITVDRSPERGEKFKALQKEAIDLLTEEYCGALRARSISLIPTIRKNSIVFSRAASKKLGSARAGDQYGTLLAGAYSLYSSNEISKIDAEKWVEEQDWGEAIETNEDTDERRCLSFILESTIRVAADRSQSSEMAIAEAIEGLYYAVGSSDIGNIASALGRCGIRVGREDGGGIHISNSHIGISRILEKTPWATNWKGIIKRLPGAKPGGIQRFSGSQSRSIWIPIKNVI